MTDSAVDKISIIRKFILSAPAGELRDVLKPLRTLTSDDDTFFSVISDCCLEYHLRHQSCFSIATKEGGGGGGGGASNTAAASVVMTSKANHLVTRVKQFLKASNRKLTGSSSSSNGGDVEGLLEEYFSSGEGRLGCKISQPQDLNVEGEKEEEEIAFDDITRVFFDFNTALYFEVDPVESKVIRTLPFLGGSPSSTESGEIEIAAAVYEAVEAVLAAESSDYFGVVPYLVAEVATYVTKNYVEANVDERNRMLVAALGGSSSSSSSAATPAAGSKGGTAAATSSQQQQREALSNCASHVSVNPAGTSITISITSERYQPKSFWAGRWKSIFVVSTITPPSAGDAGGDDDGESSGVSIVGETRIHTHSFEDGGNIHMEVTKSLPRRIIVPSKKLAEEGFNVGSIAKKILKEIKSYEAAIQSEMEACCSSVGEKALKRLRRKLPISKLEFNFRKASSRAARYD